MYVCDIEEKSIKVYFFETVAFRLKDRVINIIGGLLFPCSLFFVILISLSFGSPFDFICHLGKLLC